MARHALLWLQQSGSLGLIVISESDSRTLLIHRICREDIYQRQGGATLLTSSVPGNAWPVGQPPSGRSIIDSSQT